mmetsp:Transcript_119763/g.187040  ORF Transcript_119763/g.187040 Transcript_119763/m.187040 type:complete len:224 (-) Transcript_119763:310-981(-)
MEGCVLPSTISLLPQGTCSSVSEPSTNSQSARSKAASLSSFPASFALRLKASLAVAATAATNREADRGEPAASSPPALVTSMPSTGAFAIQQVSHPAFSARTANSAAAEALGQIARTCSTSSSSDRLLPEDGRGIHAETLLPSTPSGRDPLAANHVKKTMWSRAATSQHRPCSTLRLCIVMPFVFWELFESAAIANRLNFEQPALKRALNNRLQGKQSTPISI